MVGSASVCLLAWSWAKGGKNVGFEMGPADRPTRALDSAKGEVGKKGRTTRKPRSASLKYASWLRPVQVPCLFHCGRWMVGEEKVRPSGGRPYL